MSEGHTSAQTRDRVLVYLEREADFDGLVTVSQTEIGSVVGVSQSQATNALDDLEAGGLIRRLRRGQSGSRPAPIQLLSDEYTH